MQYKSELKHEMSDGGRGNKREGGEFDRDLKQVIMMYKQAPVLGIRYYAKSSSRFVSSESTSPARTDIDSLLG
jgi:hypothetical protein